MIFSGKFSPFVESSVQSWLIPHLGRAAQSLWDQEGQDSTPWPNEKHAARVHLKQGNSKCAEGRTPGALSARVKPACGQPRRARAPESAASRTPTCEPVQSDAPLQRLPPPVPRLADYTVSCSDIFLMFPPKCKCLQEPRELNPLYGMNN